MAEQNETAQAPAEEPGVRRVKLTSMRKAIAKRLVESQRAIAQSGGSYEIDATELLALRQRLLKKEETLGTRITVTDIVSYALIKALGEFPNMTAFMTDAEMIYHDYIHLGVAVTLESGLVTVVIKNAEKMSLAELSKAVKELSAKAKAKRLTMEDISDGTFTMSSLGPNSSGGVGIPLVATPQAGIVQFGAILRQPAVINEQIVIRSMMRINISYDHRIVDGAEVARFNQKLRSYIEDPSWIQA
jgi:pyruvate/2-oxoglutarate dehydrogenase complex dihydrolipoamide acyltransferase (E2) component